MTTEMTTEEATWTTDNAQPLPRYRVERTLTTRYWGDTDWQRSMCEECYSPVDVTTDPDSGRRLCPFCASHNSRGTRQVRVEETEDETPTETTVATRTTFTGSNADLKAKAKNALRQAPKDVVNPAHGWVVTLDGKNVALKWMTRMVADEVSPTMTSHQAATLMKRRGFTVANLK